MALPKQDKNAHLYEEAAELAAFCATRGYFPSLKILAAVFEHLSAGHDSPVAAGQIARKGYDYFEARGEHAKMRLCASYRNHGSPSGEARHETASADD